MTSKPGFTQKTIISKQFGEPIEIVLREPTIQIWHQYARVVSKKDSTPEDQIEAEARFLSECVLTTDGERIFKIEDIPLLIKSYCNAHSLLVSEIISLLELDKIFSKETKKK